ncbi:5' nucleotidase, NT5C type [Neobacillus mesonae]|uniref:5' nucleotidase, NT5C type n=1 Tax=Neobacillus mesonae TaxID=1193713 RepID=UPI00203B284C|nr:hypothetical protein [Neobacillus mesonae]MCM3566597.1 hypothetical protein [Neobacillus mesonae]
MKKNFGIDIDGTVTCPTSMIPFINEAFNLNLTYEEIDQYDLTPFVNVSSEAFAEWFSKNEPVIYKESPIALGAEEALNKWKKAHELFFISARGPHLMDVTQNWFIKHGITFHHIELIGSHDKVETVKKHHIDIFFEDKHDNAVAIHEECKIPVILFNTPYNQDAIPNGVIRVNNWNEAAEWVDNWLHQEKRTYQMAFSK